MEDNIKDTKIFIDADTVSTTLHMHPFNKLPGSDSYALLKKFISSVSGPISLSNYSDTKLKRQIAKEK